MAFLYLVYFVLLTTYCTSSIKTIKYKCMSHYLQKEVSVRGGSDINYVSNFSSSISLYIRIERVLNLNGTLSYCSQVL